MERTERPFLRVWRCLIPSLWRWKTYVPSSYYRCSIVSSNCHEGGIEWEIKIWILGKKRLSCKVIRGLLGLFWIDTYHIKLHPLWELFGFLIHVTLTTSFDEAVLLIFIIMNWRLLRFLGLRWCGQSKRFHTEMEPTSHRRTYQAKAKSRGTICYSVNVLIFDYYSQALSEWEGVSQALWSLSS